MSSSVSKIFQHVKPKTRSCKGGIHLSWPSPPVSPRSQRFPLQVPNIINPSKHPLSLSESTYYLLTPKQREPENWKPWTATMEEVEERVLSPPESPYSVHVRQKKVQRWRPWIARVEEVDSTTWRLLNPLSGISNFLEADPPILGKPEDPSNYVIKELARSYTLIDDYGGKKLETKASKVIPLSNEQEEMTLLAIDWDGKLALWKQGDENWTRILDDNPNGFSDIVSCRGNFYAADHLGTLFKIDPTKSSKDDEFIKIITTPKIPPKEEDCDHLFMAEYNGQVHLLIYDELNLKDGITRVYALDDGHGREPHRWDMVKTLNNHVLFILNEVSFSLLAYILERKFEGDWICLHVGHEHISELGFCGSGAGVFCNGTPFYREGLDSLEYISYPVYVHYFSKCNLALEDGKPNVKRFYMLPDHEYVSLFFPPPPWIHYYCLDAHQGYPSVRFDVCYLPKFEF